MIIILVAFVIFASFSKGSFLQEKVLLSKQSEAIGEIPCSASPSVQFVNTIAGVYFINSKPGLASNMIQFVNLPLTAKISSSCLEDIAVTWIYGDGQQEDRNCTYVAGKYVQRNITTGDATDLDCGFMNHTYLVEQGGLWTIKDIRLQVFGLRSAYYTEAEAVGFVTDPNFIVSFTKAPDTSDYSCVLLNVNSTNTIGENINSSRFNILDNSRLQSAEFVNYSSDTDAIASYRATAGKLPIHTIQVFATHGYQTTNSTEVKFNVPAKILPRKEILVYGSNGDLEVLQNSTMLNGPACTYPGNPGLGIPSFFIPLCPWNCVKDDKNAAKCGGPDFPRLDNSKDDLTPVAVTSGDVNLDGGDEIIVLLKSTGKNKHGEILAFKNSDFPRDADFSTISLDSLKDKFMYADTSNEKWVDIAVGHNISVGDGRVIEKAIIALSQDSLALYEVQGNSIVLVDETDLPTKDYLGIDSWKRLATADFDGDGEDEILALGGNSLYGFKRANLANMGRYGIALDKKNWVGLAAGNLDGGGKKDDAVVIADNGGIEWMRDIFFWSDTSKKGSLIGVPVGNQQFESKFPKWIAVDPPEFSVVWRDMTAADVNKDGTDELVTIDENANNDEVCMFRLSTLISLTADDWKTIDYNMTAFKEKVTPICLTSNEKLTRSDSIYFVPPSSQGASGNPLPLNWDWISIAAGDVACFL